MNVKAMNCPNCGAGIAADSIRCEFCRSRLKTVACLHCLGLLFVGAKHCIHCGRKTIPIAESDKDRDAACPRCSTTLELIMIGNVAQKVCDRCAGVWMSTEAFEQICTDREKQSAVLALHGPTAGSVEMKKISYVPCPVCGQLMNRSNFARASGIIIDTCRSHGVWFDADELPRIVSFIREGGMRIARQRDLRDMEEQRERMRNESRAASFRSSFTSDSLHGDEQGVKGFLRKLFE